MDPNAKQLAVEKLKSSTSVLVTVSNNPSEDDLAAAIGFSLLLGKLNKHASAVFSGAIPPAIQFLEPSKQFEQDVAGLRDFIIALDKEKADKLRYKVEDDVVKIFITPYKNKISKDDLMFSEGDFNVDAVVALNVARRDDLDGAIKAHGRILHDAAVITISAGSNSSNLGSIDWQDPSASSLCEMLVSISESFGSGLLDQQISTAFLTGIVAATDRFSNPKTSPKVMTMAAQLMAAGANQQLIADNLAPVTSNAQTTNSNQPPKSDQKDDSQLKIDHDPQGLVQPLPQAQPQQPIAPAEEPKRDLKSLEDQISNLATGPKTSVDQAPPDLSSPTPAQSQPQPVNPPATPTILPPSQVSDRSMLPPQNLPPAPPMQSQLPKAAQPAEPVFPQPSQVFNPTPSVDTPPPPPPPPPVISGSKGHGPRDLDENPLMGGTFNATSAQAHDETVRDIKSGVNSTLLAHPTRSYMSDSPSSVAMPATSQPEDEQEGLAMGGVNANSAPPPPKFGAATSDATQTAAPRPDSQESQPSDQSDISVDEARKAVEDAFGSVPFDPAGHPTASIGSQPLPNDDPSHEDKSGDNQFELPGQ